MKVLADIAWKGSRKKGIILEAGQLSWGGGSKDPTT